MTVLVLLQPPYTPVYMKVGWRVSSQSKHYGGTQTTEPAGHLDYQVGHGDGVEGWMLAPFSYAPQLASTEIETGPTVAMAFGKHNSCELFSPHPQPIDSPHALPEVQAGAIYTSWHAPA